MKLYRPVGLYEMEKILDMNGKCFPNRYSSQPIFYPVLNETYASEIAGNWNKKDSRSGYVGFVTAFEVDDNYIKNFEKHCVGDKIHEELWIPANKLGEFNENISGKIHINKAYYGHEFSGIKGFNGVDIENQISFLDSVMKYNYMDFSRIVFVEWKLINLNFLLWYEVFTDYHKTLQEVYKCLLKNDQLYINIKNI